MMHGAEKSDPAIVAGKPANKAMSTLRSIPRGCQSLRSRWSEGRGPRGMRASKARPDSELDCACHRRGHAYGRLPSHTRGGRRYGAGGGGCGTFIVHAN